MKILVTGCAGFIGSHLCKELHKRGNEVSGIDNFSELPYGVSIKNDRMKDLKFVKFTYGDVCDPKSLEKILDVDCVCHLAALAGVRASMENPLEYIKSNVLGLGSVLESCRLNGVNNVVYASSSSVYGRNALGVLKEDQRLDRPVSLYAATKKSDELIAHSYHHLYKMNLTGLRFFTVYGPWGRPDMALFKFAKNILAGRPIQVYNYGNMHRDFTYVDDIVNGIIRCIENVSGFDIYNIGHGSPENLSTFIEVIENACGKKAITELLPLQPGDVTSTHADISKIKELGYKPTTSIFDGVPKTIDWMRSYYG